MHGGAQRALTPAHPGLTLDPDVQRDTFRTLLPIWYRGDPVNAVWPFMFDSDAEVIELRLKRRRHQLVRLARYARVGSPGALLGWDDVPIAEIEQLVADLYEVLESEGLLTKVSEDA